MTTTDKSKGPRWRSTTVIGREVTLKGAELLGQTGVCAACRRPFREHTDAQLQACAATFEETQPTGDEA